MNRQLTTYTPIDITDIAGQLSKKSEGTYTNDAKRFAEWMYQEGLTIGTLTRSHMVAYRKHLGEHYAKSTAQRMLTVARRILKEQVINGSIDTNPAEDVRGFKLDNETPHTALTKAQAKELFDSVDRNTKKGLRDYAILMLLLRTGLRRAECASLAIGDIKSEQGHMIVVVQHGKGDKRRIAKLPVDVFRAIETYIKAVGRDTVSPDAPLFIGFEKGDTSNNVGITDKTLERIVKQYGERIGVEITPHCLRATFITLSLEGGAQLHQVQYAAGHSDPRTTEHYQKRKLNLDDNATDYIKF